MVKVQVISELSQFESACEQLRAGEGPLAIDAERASGFTYSQRAYLIQVFRRSSGTFLFDPPALGDMSALMSDVSDEEFVLHAASQDLACLREVGISPHRIFDTELSARLLGFERVGLGAVVQNLLDVHLAKEHSAADWSTRPLPESWLSYAALDVEHLVDLRDVMHRLLTESNKLEWAEQEFQATLDKPDKPLSLEPWRATSGIHALKTQQQLAVARSLWLTRDQIAQERNIAPRRLIPDASIVAAAKTSYSTKSELARSRDFHGAASRSLLDQWWSAIEKGRADENLPQLRIRSDTLPPPRAWVDRKPEAAVRFQLAREALTLIATEHQLPLENLFPPAVLREVCWEPPTITSPATSDPPSHSIADAAAIAHVLRERGARPWQISLCLDAIVAALNADSSHHNLETQ